MCTCVSPKGVRAVQHHSDMAHFWLKQCILIAMIISKSFNVVALISFTGQNLTHDQLIQDYNIERDVEVLAWITTNR